MSVKDRVAAALALIGREVFIIDDGGSETALTASVQPVRAVPPEDAGPLGAFRRRRCVLYAAPGDGGKLAVGSSVRVGGSVFRVICAESFYLSGEAVYRRAVLEAIGEGCL